MIQWHHARPEQRQHSTSYAYIHTYIHSMRSMRSMRGGFIFRNRGPSHTYTHTWAHVKWFHDIMHGQNRDSTQLHMHKCIYAYIHTYFPAFHIQNLHVILINIPWLRPWPWPWSSPTQAWNKAGLYTEVTSKGAKVVCAAGKCKCEHDSVCLSGGPWCWWCNYKC